MTDLFQTLLLIPAGVAFWALVNIVLGIKLVSKCWRAPERRERRARA